MTNIAKSAELVGRIIGIIFGEGFELPSSKNIAIICDVNSRN